MCVLKNRSVEWLRIGVSALAIFFALSLSTDSLVFAQTLPLPAHVVVVIEENHSYSQIIGSSQAP
jgi:acid phosphatase